MSSDRLRAAADRLDARFYPPYDDPEGAATAALLRAVADAHDHGNCLCYRDRDNLDGDDLRCAAALALADSILGGTE